MIPTESEPRPPAKQGLFEVSF